MGPHKDPSKLPAGDQLKLIRDSIDELSNDIYKLEIGQRQQEAQLKLIRIESKETNKKFDKLYRNLEKWKSQIHDLIDKGFSSKAKKLDEEVGILNNRTIELRNRMQTLEIAAAAV